MSFPSTPCQGGQETALLAIPPYHGGFRGVQGDFGNFARVGVIGNVYLFLAFTIYSRATYKYLKAPEGRHVYSWATCKYLKAQRGDMFIARSIHQTQQSPRGATCDSAIREDYLTQGRKAAKTQGNVEVFSPRGAICL